LGQNDLFWVFAEECSAAQTVYEYYYRVKVEKFLLY